MRQTKKIRLLVINIIFLVMNTVILKADDKMSGVVYIAEPDGGLSEVNLVTGEAKTLITRGKKLAYQYLLKIDEQRLYVGAYSAPFILNVKTGQRQDFKVVKSPIPPLYFQDRKVFVFKEWDSIYLGDFEGNKSLLVETREPETITGKLYKINDKEFAYQVYKRDEINHYYIYNLDSGETRKLDIGGSRLYLILDEKRLLGDDKEGLHLFIKEGERYKFKETILVGPKSKHFGLTPIYRIPIYYVKSLNTLIYREDWETLWSGGGGRTLLYNFDTGETTNMPHDITVMKAVSLN